jgi:hypothetical protein
MDKSELKAAMNSFLDRNVERIRFRHKGLMDSLKNEFEQQYNVEITRNFLSTSIANYRKAHNIPLELNDNPYYHPRPRQPRRRQNTNPLNQTLLPIL